MSQETLADLNAYTKIGMVEQRGKAWHRRDDLQGEFDNHYPGFIPLADVMRDLFNWSPVQAQVAYLVPVGVDDPLDAAIYLNGQAFRVVPTRAERVGVLRSDNDYDLGVFKEGVSHPPYQVSLVREAERLTGTTLGISSAGLLAKGARAWVEFSMPETCVDPKSGFGYRPNLLKADSMDGSISLTTALTIYATVCDNTLTANLLEAKRAGMLFRRKHTSGIVGDLSDERNALGILEATDAEFTADLHALIEREVSKGQVGKVLDIIIPIPPDATPRSITLANNKRDRWMSVYESDPMASTWKGTAFGVVQANNTFEHHYATAKGTGRSERNTWRAIMGKTAQSDRSVVAALETVLA